MILPVALAFLSNLLVRCTSLIDSLLTVVLFRPLLMENKCSCTGTTSIIGESIAGKTSGSAYGGPESHRGF